MAKVWGAVKFFHPYLAYREIDWDKALIETLPRVNSARSVEEYQAAVNQMFAVLNDKSTRAEIELSESEAEKKVYPQAQTAAADEKLVRTENGIVIINAAKIAAAVGKDNSTLSGFVTSVTQALPNATGIVIDARSQTEFVELDLYYFGVFLRQALTAMLDTRVVLGSARYRMHNGYATQTGSGASFYSSSLLTAAPEVIQGQSKTKTPPMAVIINEHSPSFAETLSGLQHAVRAFVIQDGERAPDSGGGSFTIKLPDNVKVRIRTSELINPDGSVDLQPDTVVASNTDNAAL
ncbi:MAG TPA: hypothetical protein VGD38_18530, partial [Pyrinomonadaceae bacterium]